MRVWFRVRLVILGLALVTIAGVFILGQYAPPGLSSYLAQSLSIAILSLGIASSTVAVLSGRGIEEYFKRRDEEKRIKSALVSYLAGLPLQILAITSVFYGLSKGTFSSTLSIRPVLDDLVRPNSIDTSYYEKNIKDRLLYLPQPLASQAMAVNLFVALINYNYAWLVKDISSNSFLLKGPAPADLVLSNYLGSHRKAHLLMSELGNQCRDLISTLANAMLKGAGENIDFQPIYDKMETVQKAYDSAYTDFRETLSQSSAKSSDVSSSST